MTRMPCTPSSFSRAATSLPRSGSSFFLGTLRCYRNEFSCCYSLLEVYKGRERSRVALGQGGQPSSFHPPVVSTSLADSCGPLGSGGVDNNDRPTSLDEIPNRTAHFCENVWRNSSTVR